MQTNEPREPITPPKVKEPIVESLIRDITESINDLLGLSNAPSQENRNGR